jgi:hypothetical protein
MINESMGRSLEEETRSILLGDRDSALSLETAESLHPASQQDKSDSDRDGDSDYNPVPPKRTFNIKVRYQYDGKMEPLPYPSDN